MYRTAKPDDKAKLRRCSIPRPARSFLPVPVPPQRLESHRIACRARGFVTALLRGATHPPPLYKGHTEWRRIKTSTKTHETSATGLAGKARNAGSWLVSYVANSDEATKRQTRLRDSWTRSDFSVMDFCAKGDGATDDSTAINIAIREASR